MKVRTYVNSGGEGGNGSSKENNTINLSLTVTQREPTDVLTASDQQPEEAQTPRTPT